MKIQCVDVIDCTHSDDGVITADKDKHRQSTNEIAAYAGLEQPTDEEMGVQKAHRSRANTQPSKK